MFDTPTKEFKLSREIYSLMLDVSNIGVWEWPDLNEADLRWSSGMYKFYDMDPSDKELSFTEVLELIHPDDRAHVQTIIQNHLQTGSELKADYRMITKKGNLKWLNASGKAQRNEDGIPISMVGAIYEITEIKTREEELKSMAQFLSRVEEWSEMGSCKWFNRKDQYWLSAGAHKVLGIDKTENITLQELLKNVHVDDRVRVHQQLRKTPGVEGYKIEFRLELDGIKHIELGSYLFKDALSGEEVVTGVIKDKTVYQNQIDSIADLNQELERSNEELEQFAYIASHDMQEPLRKIQTFSERLRERATGLDERSLDYMSRMDNAASRMQTLIQDLLEFSRIARNEGEPQLIQVSDLMDKVKEDLGARIESKDANVRIHTMPAVTGHESQLYRLFLNLMSNALKFSREGVVPDVKVHSKLSAKNELIKEGFKNVIHDEYISIAVEDNGIGFDEVYLEKVFAIFQRLHGRAEYEGTGIGLAVCQRIVANHDGFITARSKPNEGATFYVYLPLN